MSYQINYISNKSCHGAFDSIQKAVVKAERLPALFPYNTKIDHMGVSFGEILIQDLHAKDEIEAKAALNLNAATEETRVLGVSMSDCPINVDIPKHTADPVCNVRGLMTVTGVCDVWKQIESGSALFAVTPRNKDKSLFVTGRITKEFSTMPDFKDDFFDEFEDIHEFRDLLETLKKYQNFTNDSEALEYLFKAALKKIAGIVGTSFSESRNEKKIDLLVRPSIICPF